MAKKPAKPKKTSSKTSKKPQSKPKQKEDKETDLVDGKEDNLDSQSAKFDADYMAKAYRVSIARKIASGDKGLGPDIEYLRELDARQKAQSSNPEIVNPKSPIEEEVGIPSDLRIPRRYTMSDAARKARSKGGQARAKKCPNPNWKHGRYARSAIAKIKPCKTTCGDYPCALIEEGKVEPGETCLDMVSLVETYQAFYTAIKDGKYEDYMEITALSIAQAQTVLNMLLEDIIRDNSIVKSQKIDKDGNVIGYEIKAHPSLLVLPKLIDGLGMTPQESMITPRQIAKNTTKKKGYETLAEYLSQVGRDMKTQADENKQEED